MDNLITTFFALIPILWLFISLGFVKMPAYKACSIGLFIALSIAVAIWQMPMIRAIEATIEGGVLALLPILWVIVAAFFTFNISLKTGAMDQIKNLMSSLSGDRRIQALIIAWGFGGFLEATAGFGTAVAIPAAILIALGFEPFFAAVICLISNTIAVAFGVVGIPVTTLAKVTDLPVMSLSMDVVFQLTPFVLLLPFIIVCTITKSIKGCKGVLSTTLTAGVSFGFAQFMVAKFVGPELPAIAGSVLSFFAVVICARILPPSEEWRFPNEKNTEKSVLASHAGNHKDQLIAWSPYLFLLIFVLGTSNLVPVIHEPLSQIKSVVLIYHGSGGKPMSIDWILTPGTLIFLAAILGGLVQGASPKTFVVTIIETLVQLKKTFITIITIVGMAKVLGYSGMTGSIAVALAGVAGNSYPLFAPLIGALGTFITGSDTSSNVLFGALQKETALQIGANPSWLAAANASGACAGKLISPQSIAIAASATGLNGQEGTILSATYKYIFVFLIGLGLLVFAFAF